MRPAEATVGIDLGGTSLCAVVADGKGNVLGSARSRTPQCAPDPEPVVEEIVAVVRKATKRSGLRPGKLKALGIGAPGSVDQQSGLVMRAVNLGWYDLQLGQLLSERLGLESFVANDVQMAMLGEHSYGAAKGADTAVAVWVGTGIGGGVIINRELFGGLRGSAGEVGHIVIASGGPLCVCGKTGCAEAFASRTAIARDIQAAIAAGAKSLVPEILVAKGKDRITSSVLLAAIEGQDQVVKEVLGRAQEHLSVLVGNLLCAYDPEVVVLGGGVVEKLQEGFVAPIRELALAATLCGAKRQKVRIVPSALGDLAGALGASVLARQLGDRPVAAL